LRKIGYAKLLITQLEHIEIPRLKGFIVDN